MSAKTTPTIQAEVRQRTGTRYAQRLRKAGKMPAVIYGHGKDPAHVAVDAEEIAHMLRHGTHLLSIDLGKGKPETCLVKDVQYNYLGDTMTHVDLTRVNLSEKVTVQVPINCVREDKCIGLKQAGAYLEHLLNDIEVECRADQIPDGIEVDVAELDLEQTLTVADLVLPDGVMTPQSPESAVVAVHMSRAHEELEEAEAAEAEAAEEGAEPEVIGKGKDEETESNE